MKNFCFYLILFLCSNLVYAKDSIEIDTPYGRLELSDDDQSSKFLEWLTTSTGITAVDSINSTIILNVSMVSDGALAEILGSICLTDFINKPLVYINILKDIDDICLENLATIIGWELSVNSNQIENKINRYINFRKSTTEALLKQGISPDQTQIQQFLSNVRAKYSYFIDNQ